MKRVLVVDDDTDIREVVSDLLESVGYDVARAENGLAALREMRLHLPDLVILDLMMPVMDGWQFRAEQKRDADLAQVPVLVISAATTHSDVDAACFIPKPFDADRLLNAVQRLVA